MQCVSSIIPHGCSNEGHPIHNGLCWTCEQAIVRSMHAMLERKGEHALGAELAALYLTRKWCRYCLRTGNCGHDQRDAL
jgi:hypothetical protein